MADLFPSVVYSLLCLLSVALLCFLCFCVYIHQRHKKYAHLPGPERASFFFGHVPIFRENIAKGKEFIEVIAEWSLNYDGLMVIWFFISPRIFIYEKSMIKDIVVKYNLRKPAFMKKMVGQLFGERFLHNGLVTELDHDRWKLKRRAANPAFYRSHLKTLMPDYNKSSDKLVKKLNTLADGKTEVKMLDYFHRVTLDVIGKVAFDLDLNSLEDDHTVFPEAISNCLQALVFVQRNPFHKFNPWTYGFQKKVVEDVKLIRETGHQCIQKRKEAMARGEEMPNDILSTMMKLLDLDSLQVTDEDLVDDFMTFFVAGQETTANQLSFALYEICSHQDILDKLLVEIEEVLGSRDNIEFDDLSKLQYLGQVLKEALRLYPPASAFARHTKDELTLNGYSIPGDSIFFVSMFASHRSPVNFEDPLKFDPDRWSPEKADKMPYFAYFPFSTGPRNCIGQVFAQFEAKVVMARFLKTFDAKLCPGQTNAVITKGTLSPRDGVMCTLTPR